MKLADKIGWAGVGSAIGAVTAWGSWLAHERPVPAWSPAKIDAFVSWVGVLILEFVPWPALVLLLLAIPKCRRYIWNLAWTFRNAFPRADVEFGPFKMTQKQREELEQSVRDVGDHSPEQLADIISPRLQAIKEWLEERLDNSCKKHKVQEKLESLFSIHLDPSMRSIESASAKPARCALHMRSPLFEDSVIQITEYAPKVTDHADKSRHRHFSTRHGIVGLAWRTGKPQYDGNVSTDENELITKWGMTREEARRAGHGRQSHLAIPFPRASEEPTFVLFFDAGPTEIFGDESQNAIFETVYKGIEEIKLDEALGRMFAEFSHLKPIIKKHQGS